MRVRYEGVTLRNRRNPVLTDLSLVAPAGEITCLYGPTRSGKSSLLLMTGGYLLPTAGQIYLGEAEVGSAPMQARRLTGLGIIPDFNPLFGNLSVAENLACQCRLYGVKAVDRRVAELLQQLDLTGVAGRMPDELNQPETLRTGLAMALVHNPPVVLLDEPGHALTTVEFDQQWPHIERLKAEGKTVLVTTHSLWVAQRSDRTFHMPAGKELEAHVFHSVGLARPQATHA